MNIPTDSGTLIVLPVETTHSIRMATENSASMAAAPHATVGTTPRGRVEGGSTGAEDLNKSSFEDERVAAKSDMVFPSCAFDGDIGMGDRPRFDRMVPCDILRPAQAP